MSELISVLQRFDRFFPRVSEKAARSLASVERYVATGFGRPLNEMAYQRKSDTLFVLGSGPSINELGPDEWRYMKSCDTIAFNNFIAHDFVPDIYVAQRGKSDRATPNFVECFNNRCKAYSDTKFILRGDTINNFSAHEHPGYEQFMRSISERAFFGAEVFIQSDTAHNPVVLLEALESASLGISSNLLFKAGATVPLIHVLGAQLGFKSVVFLGIDMNDATHFYDDPTRKFAAKFDGTSHSGPHPHNDLSKRRFTIPRIISDQAAFFMQRQVRSFVSSNRSRLWPSLPKYDFPSASLPATPPRLNRKLKICFLAPSFHPKVGGMELQLENLATKLHEQGHRVHVFAPRYSRADDARSYPFPVHRHTTYLNDAGLLECAQGTRPLPGARFGLGAAVINEHRSEPFDLIVAYSAYRMGNIGLALRRLLDVPMVLRTHGLDINKNPEIGYGWRLDADKEALIAQSVEGADRCIAISSSVADLLAEFTTAPKVDLIWNGVDVDGFAQGKVGIRERFGIRDGAVVGLMVGRNVVKKQFDRALQYFGSSPLAHRSDWNMLMVGADMKMLQSRVDALGLTERVILIDRIAADEMPDVYACADIFVMPSLVETFGAVTIEAMASGLPVVGLRAPGTEDQVEHGLSGLLVDDLTMLPAAFFTLLTDPPTRIQMGRAARDRAVAGFGWDEVVGKYINTFEKAVNQRECRFYPERDLDVEAYEYGDRLISNIPYYASEAYYSIKKRIAMLVDIYVK